MGFPRCGAQSPVDSAHVLSGVCFPGAAADWRGRQIGPSTRREMLNECILSVDRQGQDERYHPISVRPQRVEGQCSALP